MIITFFREFYYIQMEKYARQALSEGIKNAEDIRVSLDSELYRVLNLHYNRNNHIEVNNQQLFRNILISTTSIHLTSLTLSDKTCPIKENHLINTEMPLFVFRFLIGSDGLLNKH